jgi:3-oxoacyl-[acyl-carrier protein] reductase
MGAAEIHDDSRAHWSQAFTLSGRTAVITGAASAIGAAVAFTLASAGANVVMSDVDESGLDATARELEELMQGKVGVVGLRTDVTSRAEVEALVRRAVSEFGRVDVMANLAGTIHDGLVVETDEADLDRVLAVNLKGVYFGCQAAVPVMTEQGTGSIVNMSSSGAFLSFPQLSCYSMSKTAVVALTRVLAVEVGPVGIRVNAIAPGFIEGGMTMRRARNADGTLDEEKMNEERARWRKRCPLRITGQPADVANAVLYLASDASRYMTGQVLHPNGGTYMP